MTNLNKKISLSFLLGSVAFLAVACGGGKESATPMQPNNRKVITGDRVMKAFRGYKADSKLASGVSGATAETKASTTSPGLFDASVKILLHATSGELVGLSATGAGLEAGKPRLLTLDSVCGNAKYDIEAMCADAKCINLAVRVIEKPAANSPKIAELEVGKQTPDTTGYAQTALVFISKEGAAAARARQAARLGKGAAKASAETSVAAAPAPTAAPTPVKMMRLWSERWTTTADPDSAAGVKTSFEEAIALVKGQGTATAIVEACFDPNAVVTPAVTSDAAVPAETASADSTAKAVEPAASGVSEINENPLN